MERKKPDLNEFDNISLLSVQIQLVAEMWSWQGCFEHVLKCHFKTLLENACFLEFFLHVILFLPTFADVSLRQKKDFLTTGMKMMENDIEYDGGLYGAPDPVALDAAAVVAKLVRLPSGSVSWHGSKRCLVELVARAAEARVLTDGCGGTATRVALCRELFRVVGMEPPRRLSSVVYRIRNRVTRQAPLGTRVREALGETAKTL